MIYSPLRYALHVSGDNPTHHQEYCGCLCDLRYEQVTRCAKPYCLRSVTRVNSSMVGCCTRLVAQCPTAFVAKVTPKVVGLYETCNLLIPEAADTAIVPLMMGGIVTRNM